MKTNRSICVQPLLVLFHSAPSDTSNASNVVSQAIEWQMLVSYAIQCKTISMHISMQAMRIKWHLVSVFSFFPTAIGSFFCCSGVALTRILFTTDDVFLSAWFTPLHTQRDKHIQPCTLYKLKLMNSTRRFDEISLVMASSNELKIDTARKCGEENFLRLLYVVFLLAMLWIKYGFSLR